jgi:adenylosuccinate synthase
MPVTVVIGSQWGDEGKGKLVDLMSEDADVVARYQGGANAGHTICWGDGDDGSKDRREFVLHLIPSGIFHEGTTCVIGNGVVLDPAAVLDEIEKIEALGYDVEGRLKISHNAHLIMPYHKQVEAAQEAARTENTEDAAIGTTGRGIGPAYTDKFARRGIRVVDLLAPEALRDKLTRAIEDKNALLEGVYDAAPLDVDEIVEEYVAFDEKIDPYVTDTSQYLNRALANGERVLAEGAQGSLLDVDFGTYPFVTSSHPTAGGCCTGLGVSPTAVERAIGVVKAYSTRVGNGPFVTELDGQTGEALREAGGEFGATTGRPRRCGWLDLVALGYTASVNGFTEIAVTKLDVLSGMDELKVCTRYRLPSGEEVRRFPSEVETLRRAEPVYETLPGWDEDITGVREAEALPPEARDYLRFIEKKLSVTVGRTSVGPRREQVLTGGARRAAATAP